MDYDPAIPRLRTWEKPPELETRSRWERDNRRVLKGEKPTAVQVYELTRKKYTGDASADGEKAPASETVPILREVGLYAFEQTVAFRPSPRTLALREFRNVYLRYSSSQYYLWHSDGEWNTCHGRLSDERFLDHIAHEAIYGVRGNGRCTRFGGIDLDLHKGDRTIFLEQLNILLEEFQGRDGWHFQVADINAQGVHFLQVFPEPLDYELYRAELRARLQALDQKYPELAIRAKQARMKSLGDLEIFPNVKNGLRLPFCRGRTMLLDKPLAMILVRGKYVVDVEKYILWVNTPTPYMPRQDVYEYILTRLRQDGVAQAGVNSDKTPVNTPIQQNSAASGSKGTVSNNVSGQYANNIVAFWSGNDTPQKMLNRQILLLANIASFYYDSQDSAISAIEEMIDGFDNIECSNRLASGKRAEVTRVVKNNVNKAFSKSWSNPKLAATYEVWAKRGFNPFDQSTWVNSAGGLKLGADFEWTPSDKPVLDQIQAILRTDGIQAAAFAKELIRIIAGHDGELAIRCVERLLVEHDITIGSNRDRKASKVMKLLRSQDWIVLLLECSWHPIQADKSRTSGLARRYGIGDALRQKLVTGCSLYQKEKEEMYLLLPHHVQQAVLSDDDIAELVIEQARLRARISDVDLLTDKDRKALAELLSP
jgi:hypothetical protein